MTTSITLRATKGSELTHNEVDANFTNLQTTADAAAVLTTNTFSGLQTFSGGITGASNVLSVVNGTNAQSQYIYGTFTDTSNYERLKLSTTAGSGITLAAETAGTGGDNLSITLTATGTASVVITTGLEVRASTGTQLINIGSGYAVNLPNNGLVAWSSTAVFNGAQDTKIARSAAGSITVGGISNGQLLGIKTLTELTTIAAAATTDTTIQLPTNALILGVSVRVTTVVPDATDFTVGDAASAARFSTAAVSVAANSTDPGTKAGCYYNATAASVRLTFSGTPPASNTGRVRVTIHYIDVTPPTS